MRTRLERQPDGCWVLSERDGEGWRVCAEGRWWPVGMAVAVWWWASVPRPEHRYSRP
jgi:hypothetical protein